MENKAHALMAGIFTIGLLVTAVLMGVWLNRDRVERVPYEIATQLPVPGLNPQATVRYRGLDVGKVEKITFDPDVKGQILIHISVSKETPVTLSTYAVLGYQGVTGIAYVQLDDDGSKPADLSSSRKEVARIELRPGLLDKIQKRGLAILDQTQILTSRLNELLDASNQQRMLGAFDKVGQAADRIGGIPKQLEPTIAKLNSRQGALTQVSDAAERVNTAADRFDADTLPRINSLTNEISTTVRSLDRTVDQFNRNPQSILFGSRGGTPGPGEPGFAAPPERGTR